MNVPVPIWINYLADELATSRSNISASVYKQGTAKFRGDREGEISSLGIKAELMVRYVLWQDPNTCSISFSPMIDVKPIVGADMVHNGETYDIKGAQKDKGYLMVNYDAHNNPRKICDWYIFVVFGYKEAQIKKISYRDVSQWDVIQSTYTKVYKCQI
jgi:hypothetical protein